jgi:hypothetical protein
VLPIHAEDWVMEKTSQRLIYVTIFACVCTQMSRGAHCNNKEPGLVKILKQGWLRFRRRGLHQDLLETVLKVVWKLS